MLDFVFWHLGAIVVGAAVVAIILMLLGTVFDFVKYCVCEMYHTSNDIWNIYQWVSHGRPILVFEPGEGHVWKTMDKVKF